MTALAVDELLVSINPARWREAPLNVIFSCACCHYGGRQLWIHHFDITNLTRNDGAANYRLRNFLEYAAAACSRLMPDCTPQCSRPRTRSPTFAGATGERPMPSPRPSPPLQSGSSKLTSASPLFRSPAVARPCGDSTDVAGLLIDDQPLRAGRTLLSSAGTAAPRGAARVRLEKPSPCIRKTGTTIPTYMRCQIEQALANKTPAAIAELPGCRPHQTTFLRSKRHRPPSISQSTLAPRRSFALSRRVGLLADRSKGASKFWKPP
jgi:hypothetical protein